jgi:hypothetical protein
MAQTKQATGATNKISTYLMAIVLVVAGLSIASLILAGYSFYTGSEENMVAASFFAFIGIIGISLSTYLLFQTKRAVNMKIETSKVMTTIQCRKCTEKTVREYQRGDFVYKELDTFCQKCGDKQLITAIYKEVKEKEKVYNV